MATIVSGEPGERPATAPQRYDLCHREGPRRVFWRYRDAGVTVTPNGLEWTTEGARRTKPFSDIVVIRLETGSIPRSGYFAICTITFRIGAPLVVNSLNDRGLPDGDRIALYRAFVRDLHARLGPEDRQRIRFLAGDTPGRYQLGMVAAVLAGAFFVVLPLVLLAITGESKALFLTLTGAFFVYPVIRTVRKNEPRSYAPDRLTEDLFP